MNEILKRCSTLIDTGNNFISRHGDSFWYRKESIKDVQSWISSSANIVFLTATPESYFYQECQRIITDEKLIGGGMPFHVIQKLTGLIESLKNEIESGFFRQLEYIFTASAFDDFLDHANQFHKSGKKIESSILASAVFEDSIRKIAKKNEIEEAGNKLELIIDTLVKQNIFTPVKAKRIKGYSAVRNKALHAQWDDFDLSDIGQLIKGTREIIELYL